jgi:glycosyltransferase involved in cell wall biosynthesis
MRIAMVSEHASPLAVLGGVDAGGQNVHVAAIATELARLGHEVVVHTRREDADVPSRVELAPGVVVEHVDAGPQVHVPKDELLPYMDAFAAELAWAWRRQRPDVVHSHFWMSGRAALGAALPVGLPVIHTFHALDVVRRRHQGAKHSSPPEWLETERAIVRHADRLVAQCSDEVFELVRLGADRARIVVSSSGVDLDRFTSEGPTEPRGARPRVVVVSRLVERKGIGNVIEAVARLPEVELVVAGGPPRDVLGDDPEGGRLLRLADDLGIADRVDFRGCIDRDEVAPLLRSADVVACTPWYEPFGIVPLEAMACGVPVVASAVGGPIDTVVHRGTGLHVPSRDPDALAAALRELLEDEALRRQLGAAAARRVRARYSWRHTAATLSEAYRSLSGERRQAAARGSIPS